LAGWLFTAIILAKQCYDGGMVEVGRDALELWTGEKKGVKAKEQTVTMHLLTIVVITIIMAWR
jgi:hypothetical protein